MGYCIPKAVMLLYMYNKHMRAAEYLSIIGVDVKL